MFTFDINICRNTVFHCQDFKSQF